MIHGSTTPFREVHSIRVDGFGWKWLTGRNMDSYGPSLCSFDDNGTRADKSDDEWITYDTDVLTGSELRSFAIDSSSDLWIPTNKRFRTRGEYRALASQITPAP